MPGVIRNVTRGATPDGCARLERAGQRPISALVDVTNYVMLELGRPLHVYDQDKLRGAIDVRWGRPGEKVLLLNGEEVQADAGVLCITDASGPIGLAGIMGGESTKAETGTKNLFLESAFFFPAAIAGRARRYNFASDASHRFERGVDFANNVDGIERATQLILEICGGEAGPTVDLVKRLPKRKPVSMRVARARSFGVDAAKKLRRFPSQDSYLRKKNFHVTHPYRFDLEIEEDLIEEVARLHGFERTGARRARGAHARMAEAQVAARAARRSPPAITGRPSSFVEPSGRPISRRGQPIRRLTRSQPASVMRTRSSLARCQILTNARKLRGMLFQVGASTCATPSAGRPFRSVLRQPIRVARGFGPEASNGAKPRARDSSIEADLAAFAPRGPFERAASRCTPGARRLLIYGRRPGGSSRCLRAGSKIRLPRRGAVRVEADVLAWRRLPASASVRPPRCARPLRGGGGPPSRPCGRPGRNPHLSRPGDFESTGPACRPGKNHCFRVVMQDTERTLTDAEADSARDALIGLWGRRFGAILRT